MYRNHVELIGFTGSDAETKTTPLGKTVTTFSIATKTSYIKDGSSRDGARSKRQEWTEWHRVQAWGKLANTPPPSRRARISPSKASCAAASTSNGAKVGTYDIVASSITNLRADQRTTAAVPDEAAA